MVRLLKVNRSYMATLGFFSFEWLLVVGEWEGLIGRFGAHIAAVGAVRGCSSEGAAGERAVRESSERQSSKKEQQEKKQQ